MKLEPWRVAANPCSGSWKSHCGNKKSFVLRNNFYVLGDQPDLTPFDTNWKKGSGATPLTTQDL
jgi:hypothetical protein